MSVQHSADAVPRRTVLKAAGGILGGTALLGGMPIAASAESAGSFLDAFAGGSETIVARGDALVSGGSHGHDSSDSVGSGGPGIGHPDATIDPRAPDFDMPGGQDFDHAAEFKGSENVFDQPGGPDVDPEAVLVFVPRRLADEDGRIGLDDMLVLTSMGALKGDADTVGTSDSDPLGSIRFGGDRWFPDVAPLTSAISATMGDIEPTETQVVMVGERFEINHEEFDRSEIGRGESDRFEINHEEFTPPEWVELFPDEWFSDGYDGPEPIDGGEMGTPLDRGNGPGGPLVAAPANEFFSADDSEADPTRNELSWRELAGKDAAKVITSPELSG